MTHDSGRIPATLRQTGALRFWAAVVLTGAATGLSAILLTRLLQIVQRLMWGGSGTDLLRSVERTGLLRHFLILLAAGALTGIGQILLHRLSSANGIETTTAIWFYGGRLPVIRTLASAVLSVIVVGMGVSLGREGAPKQAGAVLGNVFADRFALSDEQRRLLVACGAGAGMAGAYGVPVGGSLFSLEVMRGVLGLRYVLPALFASLIAAAVASLGLPNVPTYLIHVHASFYASVALALLIGLAAGFGSVVWVRMVGWADRNKPSGRMRILAPIVVLGALGVVSLWFPELLGNGRDVSQLAFDGQVGPALAFVLLLLRPAATVFCIRSGAPGGLFTPTLTVGAMLGAALGHPLSWLWPSLPVGLCSVLGAAAIESATTQGPVSTAVLFMELTGHERSLIIPMLLAIGVATLVARTIELRSVYEARLTDEQVEARRLWREQSQDPVTAKQTFSSERAQ
jgi:H+/Cl- antiporter ClcA